jgi:primosomal protein N' (replication factor Y) (superfamily II helicase)
VARKRKPPEKLVNVAVFAAVRRALTYGLPEDWQVRPGQRVEVPLGTRRALGVALEPAARLAPDIRVRDILRIVDTEPVLSPELLALGLWIAEYYLAPVGEVFRAMLPLRAENRRVRLLRLSESGKRELRSFDSSLLQEARSAPEAELLRYLAARTQPLLATVRQKFSSSPQALERALAEGWVETFDQERARQPQGPRSVRLASGPVAERASILSPAARRILRVLEEQGAAEDHRVLLRSARARRPDLEGLHQAGWLELGEPDRRAAKESPPLPETARTLELSTAQAQVLQDLEGRLASGRYSAVLLQGVTASGKTEIYLRLIARCLELGRTALLLVPEIALTPAMLESFRARFGDRVAVLHSGLGEAERDQEWWRAKRGEAKVLLGTRSAVFAPLERLGAIIVDEEHDPSYKQQETPRYHGRDVALVRARLEGAVAVLGSATPSLESASNARQGKYHLARLEERVAGRPLASVEIVDMRREFRETVTQVPVSRRLREEIEAQLRAGEQTMILLNRRGYSWFLLCRSCGESVRCNQCSISLTYHRRQHRLICHYCGYSAPVPLRCPACGSEYLQYVGEGTEKIEGKFAEMFPQARVARLDRDVARQGKRFEQILADFRRGKIDILIGTQLIAKGHDFPGVTLAGVVSVDTGLGLPDFRAAERTFQLLTQAAGRSGRGAAPGRVLVQTFYPEHYAVRLAAEQNYEGFYSKEMRFRRLMHYPPSAALANVIAQDRSLERAAQVAAQIAKFLASLESGSSTLKILGPSPAPLARLKGRYRIQLLLKSNSRARLNETLRRLADFCELQGISPQTLMLDVDPVNMM